MAQEAISWKLPCFSVGLFGASACALKLCLAPEHAHWVPKLEGMNRNEIILYIF